MTPAPPPPPLPPILQTFGMSLLGLTEPHCAGAVRGGILTTDGEGLHAVLRRPLPGALCDARPAGCAVLHPLHQHLGRP